MADKYLIQGAAFCGTGLASNEAASAGASGAWNNINVLAGTAPAQGTLVAGDRVFIRSKTSAGADVSVAGTASVSLGLAAATEANPVVWVIDNGVVWPGVSGTVTYTASGGNYTFTLRDHNHFFAGPSKLVFHSSYASFGNTQFMNVGRCNTRGIKADLSAMTADYGGYLYYAASGTHQDWSVRAYGRYDGLFHHYNHAYVTHQNPSIELLNASNNKAVFYGADNYGGLVRVVGGEIFGAGAAEGVPVVRLTGNCSPVFLDGLKYPRVMPLSNAAMLAGDSHTVANGCDGILGSEFCSYNYSYDSRDDGYYPKRYAQLETSTATPWSYKLYPFRTNWHAPAQVSVASLLISESAAKTITLELLWPTSMAAPKKDRVWLNVNYTNAAGAKVSETTQAFTGADLDTSTAEWSTTTYGPAAFNKYKLSLATAQAVKQDTEIFCTLVVVDKSTTSNDIIFVDPDVSIV